MFSCLRRRPRQKNQSANQLCNGNGEGRRCYNFTADFGQSFNSWHDWATNYTQDILSKTTGGPVIQGPYARMGAADACDFDSIRDVQQHGFQAEEKLLHLTVIEAKDNKKGGSCKPSPKCLAAFLALDANRTAARTFFRAMLLITRSSSGRRFRRAAAFIGRPCRRGRRC